MNNPEIQEGVRCRPNLTSRFLSLVATHLWDSTRARSSLLFLRSLFSSARPSAGKAGDVFRPMDILDVPFPVRWNFPAAAVLGCAAAILFIVWRRRCVQILGSGVDTSTTSFIICLVAMGSGCVAFRLLEKRVAPRRNFVALMILAVMATTVIGQYLAPVLNLAVAGIAPLRSSHIANTLTSVLVATVLEFFPYLGVGALLSYSARSLQSGRGKTKRTMWHVYLGSAIGGIVGLMVAGRWVMPHWGILPAVAFAFCLLVVILCLITFFQFQFHASALIHLALAGMIMYGLGLGLGSGYNYGQPETRLLQSEVEFFHVGIYADVRVSRSGGERALEINGVPIASTGRSKKGELGLAYFPRLLRPNARHVLIIGLGSGTVCGASLLFPQTRVVCSENEPAVVSAAQFFADTNHQPDKSPSFSLISDDGRAVVKAHSHAFDLILVSHGDARLPDDVRLLTKQFYISAKSALSASGILAHRLKLDSFSPADVALIARTVLAEFPHCALVRISESDWILLASSSPLVDSARSVAEAQAFVDSKPQIHRDINQYFGVTNIAAMLVGHLLLDESGLRRLANRGDDDQTLITDWHLRLESTGCQRWLNGQDNGALVNRLITAAAELEWFRHNFVQCGCTNKSAAICHQLANVFAANTQFGQALEIVDWGLHLDREQPDLLADRLIWSLEEDAKVIEETVARIERKSPDAANRVGVSLWQRKLYQQAIIVFRKLTELKPDSATGWCNLAVNYQAAGQLTQAGQCFSRALALDPVNDFVKKSAGPLEMSLSGSEWKEEKPAK